MRYTSSDPETQAHIDDIYKGVLAGDAHACFRYARLILNGPHEFNDGMFYLRKAYDGGDADAAYALGYIFTSFRNRYLLEDYDWLWQLWAADDQFAYEHFLFAAEHGHAKAMMEVGRMLIWGAGCDRDVVAACAWFEKAFGIVSLCEEGCLLLESTNEEIASGELRFLRDIYSCKGCDYRSEDVHREMMDDGVFLTVDDGELVDILAPQKITHLELPESVRMMSSGLLSGLKNLKDISISADWDCVGEGCFWNCRSLRTIQLPDSVEKIARHVFGCDNPDPDSGLTAFNIPKGLMEIDPHAFGPAALNFENFTCSEGNGVFKVVDGILYERDDEGGGETLIRCPQGRTGEVVIPKGVKFVEDGAFAYCNKLTKITFLDEEIDPGPESAYEGCSDKLEKNW